MLSILITAYNEDVVPLAESLHTQCLDAAIPFEIIVCDDHSSDFFRKRNEKLTAYSGVTYRYLESNIGRARIRNLMVSMAKYQWLLFVDGDSRVVSPHFVRKYIDALQQGTVVCGGRVYNQRKPEKKEFLLHWKYGTAREQKNATLRNRFPYRSFMTSNFLCPADVFASVSFDESISGYGHEDTLFGHRLWQKGIPLVHIDNPLLHDGLIPAVEFLQKGENAVKNLAKLFIHYHNEKELMEGVRMLRAFLFIKKWYLTSVIELFLRMFQPLFLRNLNGKNPFLLFYDMIRLSWLIREIRNLKRFPV
ncbi:MAG: glycosyltransferase [Bacteroidales bacterium]|nr:glycosyltransferase [Bacteroidales bacterium]